MVWQSSFPLLLVVTVHVLLADQICEQESLWGGPLSENFDMFTVANERCAVQEMWASLSLAMQRTKLRTAAKCFENGRIGTLARIIEGIAIRSPSLRCSHLVIW